MHGTACTKEAIKWNIGPRSRRSVRVSCSSAKVVWIETSKKDVLTAALEAGATSFLFQDSQQHCINDWKSIAKFESFVATEGGQLLHGGEVAGRVARIADKSGLQQAEALAKTEGWVIMDATDWQIIPAENLVAAYQGGPAKLLGVAESSADAKVLLQALEIGTDGVVFRSDDPDQVRKVLKLVAEVNQQNVQRLDLVEGVITKVQQVGMGDRVAIDCCCLMVPGEGLLIGSYSQGLFLVHSECCESQYINSRPFRVNAGPVHAYVMMPGGRTAYLSELRSGHEVLIAGEDGKQRTAIVGRTKVERRPLVLVEARVEEELFSTFLQNAETVRLVADSGQEGTRKAGPKAVTELRIGDAVLMHRLKGARHTGIAIEESILEQ